MSGGYIVQTPDVCFGMPRIRGKGVTVANIYDLFLGEKRSYKKTARWFRLTIAEVRAAVRYAEKRKAGK